MIIFVEQDYLLSFGEAGRGFSLSFGEGRGGVQPLFRGEVRDHMPIGVVDLCP